MVRNEAEFLQVVDGVGSATLSAAHRVLLDQIRDNRALQALFGGRGQAHAVYKVFPAGRRDVWFAMVYENGDVFAEVDSLEKLGYIESAAIYRRMLKIDRNYGKVGERAQPRADFIDLLSIVAAGVATREPEPVSP